MILILITILVGFIFAYTFSINRKPTNFPKGPVSLPIIGSLYALGAKPYKNLTQMKNKYGNIIGIDFGSYRGVILNDHQVIKEAFAMLQFSGRPYFESHNFYFVNKNCKGFVWANGKPYDEQKQFIMRTLKNLGMGKRSIESLILEQLPSLYKHFDNHLSEPVLNKQLFNTVAVKALWTMMTGTQCDNNDEEFQICLNAVNTALAAASGAGPVFFLPWISKLFANISGWNRLTQSLRILRAFIEKTINSHKDSYEAGVHTPEDFIQLYLEKIAQTTDTNSSFFGQSGDNNLSVVMADLLMAGTETVAATLTWFMTLLILHPDIQERMQMEIDTVIGRVTPPSLEDKNKCPFVEACILEVLRLGSIAPLAAPHEVTEDVMLQGYLFPKGTIVVPNLYGVLHDPMLWKDPEVFNPDRFFSQNCLSVSKNNPCSFVFGSGKRFCIGETLARDEIFIIIIGLLQRYNFSIDSSSGPPKLDLDLGTSLVPKPHSMIISKR